MMRARHAYFDAFGNEGPYPYGFGDEFLGATLRAAVECGQPIADDFEWYPDLPNAAVA